MTEYREINDVSPTSLNHLIGQRSVIEQVRVALNAAQQDARKFDHALLVGPAGAGKTATAQVIACEMAAEFHEVLGQAIRGPADLNALLLAAKERDVVLIDEAHELPKEQQTALYLALDQRRVFLQGGRTERSPQSIPVADFSLLLASTDEYRLLQPLRDRMRLVLRFEFYATEDLVDLLRRRTVALQWRVTDSVLPAIARRSRGTPRLALRLLQACHRVSRSEGERTITKAHFERACLLERIDDIGLGPTDQAYLRIAADGACRLNVIASRLGLPARTVADVTEPFLIRLGLIVKDDQGRRQLTAKGRKHVSRCSNEAV